MIVFTDFVYEEKSTIVFLCGTKYRKNSPDDKRVVLENYLKDNYKGVVPLILEEHFVFGEKKGYLSYDDIFMKNLSDIEFITASFADGIIIIHDSISTGAEFAAFAVNKYIQNKICILEPDSTGIEERKISSFLELAFFNDESRIKRITYYPEVYDFYISKKHIEKRTNFSENSITRNLDDSLRSFINHINKPLRIVFEKSCFNKINSDKSVVSFFSNDGNVEIHISGQVMFYQLISLFQFSDVKKELRTSKLLYKHIDFLRNYYKKVMLNTINSMGKNENFHIDIYIKECDVSDRYITGYSIYMMQALNLIEISGDESSNEKKIVIKNSMDDFLPKIQNMIVEKKDDLAGILYD